MYICTVSEPKVSEVPHVAQLPLPTRPSVALILLSHQRARSKL